MSVSLSYEERVVRELMVSVDGGKPIRFHGSQFLRLPKETREEAWRLYDSTSEDPFFASPAVRMVEQRDE